jgi:hypothetical protein
MTERFFFAIVIVACAALVGLSAAEQMKVSRAEAARQAAPQVVHLDKVVITAPKVVQLERVVITARRDAGTAVAASASGAADGESKVN